MSLKVELMSSRKPRLEFSQKWLDIIFAIWQLKNHVSPPSSFNTGRQPVLINNRWLTMLAAPIIPEICRQVPDCRKEIYHLCDTTQL